MKTKLITLLLILFCFLAQAGNDLDFFRKDFLKVSDKNSAEKYIKSPVEDGDLKVEITVNAYKAVCKMMMAQYVSNPISKYSWFNQGKAELEKSIKMNRNVDNVHLRLMVQINAPGFLGYSSEIERDTKYILANLEKANITEEAKKIIVINLVKNDREERFVELAKKFNVK